MENPILDFIEGQLDNLESGWGQEASENLEMAYKAPLLAMGSYFLELAGDREESLVMESRVWDALPDWGRDLLKSPKVNVEHFHRYFWVRVYLTEIYRIRGIEPLPFDPYCVETLKKEKVWFHPQTIDTESFDVLMQRFSYREKGKRTNELHLTQRCLHRDWDSEWDNHFAQVNKILEGEGDPEERSVSLMEYLKDTYENRCHFLPAESLAKFALIWKELDKQPDQVEYFRCLAREALGDGDDAWNPEWFTRVILQYLAGEPLSMPEKASPLFSMELASICMVLLSDSECEPSEMLRWARPLDVNRFPLKHFTVFMNLNDIALSRLASRAPYHKH